MSEPLRGGSGDREGDEARPDAVSPAAGWQVVRRAPKRSPARRAAPFLRVEPVVSGGRFWALASECSDSEDEVVESGVLAAPSGPKVSDFVAFAGLSSGDGRQALRQIGRASCRERVFLVV